MQPFPESCALHCTEFAVTNFQQRLNSVCHCRDKIEHPGKSVAWGQWAIVGADGFGGMGSVDSGAGFEPAPDLDHKNVEVRESLKDWLRWLNNDVGYAGWRLDYVKVCTHASLVQPSPD